MNGASDNRRASLAAIAAAIAWAAVIFWMSARTSGQMGEGVFAAVRQAVNGFLAGWGFHDDPVSVLGHFSEYLVFGVLLANAFRGKIELRHAAIAAVVVASLYGITDEFHQLFVPGRACDPMDWAVDTIAAIVGAGAFCTILEKRSTGRFDS